MALTSEKQYNTFVKGLITEASPLTFPENASIDEDNFVLERNGSRSRRLGVDYEPLYGFKDTGYSAAVLATAKISFHKWTSPSGSTDVSIGVIRVQDRLWFINLLAETPSISYLNSGNYITVSGLGTNEIDTTVINNNFIITSKGLALPIMLVYNSTLNVITQSSITLKVRDYWGVDDGLAINARPSTISVTHRYNLRNQNWRDADINSTKTSIAVYPANSDIWYLSKYANPSNAEYNTYNPGILVSTNTTNALAARGSAIIDAFYRGQSRQAFSGITGLPSDIETGAISTVASYAGRVFYSGVSSSVSSGDINSPNYSGYIFFSQVVTSNESLGACYQQLDPTAEELSDLVDSDGGTIHIPDVSKIIKLVPSKSSLLVFGENGIWELYGGGSGFRATSFQVSKVSSTGVVNKNSIIEVNGSFLVWTNAGIYSITENNVDSRYKADNISLTTIQTYYNNLSELAKKYTKAFFDEKENKVRWLYNDSETYSETNYPNYYNKELVLDLTLGAFYKNSFSSLATNSPYIAGYIPFPGFSVQSTEVAVFSGNDNVLSSTDAVTVLDPIATARGTVFGYLTFRGTAFTISKYLNTSFVDWKSADGTGALYTSYLITGYETFGDTVRGKQIPYAIFFFDRTENGFTQVNGNLQIDNPSSCIVQAQWDWANSANSGKWGNPFQAYRFKRNYTPTGEADPFDYGLRVIITKNKLRGSGKALSLKITSEPNKDMKLLGWSYKVEADQFP